MKKSSKYWQSLTKIIILDPDGWDRENFEKSWEELITKEEFDNRVAHSTCIMGGFGKY